MKLLVDENLAPRLATDLADLFPDSSHVTTVALGGQSDSVLWDYAKASGFVFLTKDKDFANLKHGLRRAAEGDPRSNRELLDGGIERIIRRSAVRLAEFEKDSRRGLLILK